MGVVKSVATKLIELPPSPFRFCVVNLGCKVNRVESDSIAASLMALGGVAASEREASVIFVNTCTVTGEADKKARKAVRHALKTAPSALVYVTGCAVAIDKNEYIAIDSRIRVVDRLSLLDELARRSESSLRIGGEFRTRINIKVQDGCDRACTYCIVHVARGRARSMPYVQVIEEAKAYISAGAKEIVLAGIDLGSYRDGDKRIHHLVRELVEISDRMAVPGDVPARIRASSLEPVTIGDAFINILANADGRLCRHLHLPVQSGSTKVLREMARPYTAVEFERLVDRLYERVPRLSLTTDIIVGFPGETDDDFEMTMQLARTCRFSKIHVFPYSMREGTPAAQRIDQVSPDVKMERAARLRELSDELRAQDYARRMGTTEYCIIEPDSALTESYHEIGVPSHAEIGSLIPVLLS